MSYPQDPVAVAGKIYTTYGLGQNLGILDLATGEFTDVGSYDLPESTGLSATAIGPDGILYGMLQGFVDRGGKSQLVSIDLNTGKATPIGVANPLNAVGFDIAPDGTAYTAGFTNPDMGMKGDTVLYRISLSTGQLTAVGGTEVERIMDFAFDAAGVMWATTANEIYTIDPSTGASHHIAPITGVDTATGDPAAEIMGIMFDDHDVLYATAFIEGSPLFTIDTGTGAAAVAVQLELSFPHGGAIRTAPAAGNIYTTYGLGQNLGVLNVLTGQFRDIGSYQLPESTGLSATAFSPDGALYGMLQGFGDRGGMSQLVSIDPSTGKATPIGFYNPINAVAFDFAPDGTAYVAGFTNPDMGMKGDTLLYHLDTASGQLTVIGDTGIDRIMDFAFDSAGVMWATTANELYTLDPGTGAAHRVASITGVDSVTGDPAAEIMGIMFDEHDVLYATAFIEGSPLFTIDTTTGVATVLASPQVSFPHGGAMDTTWGGQSNAWESDTRVYDVQGENGFVGTVDGTNAFIALLVANDEAIVYVCNGDEAIYEWFRGPIDNPTDFGLTNSDGAQVQAQFSGTSFAGYVTLGNGQTHAFTAIPNAGNEVGIYTVYGAAAMQDGVVAGWILTADDERGAFRLKGLFQTTRRIRASSGGTSKTFSFAGRSYPVFRFSVAVNSSTSDILRGGEGRDKIEGGGGDDSL